MDGVSVIDRKMMHRISLALMEAKGSNVQLRRLVE